MDVEFTPQQITNITGPITIITIYNRDQVLNELYMRSRIRSSGKERFLIHYATSANGSHLKGHWVGMVVNHSNKKIYWYDSYGLMVDNGTRLIDPNFRRESNQDNRYYGRFLYRMMTELGYTVNYNAEQVQDYRPGVNTCGRFVALFLSLNRNNDVSPERFNALLKNNLDRRNSTLDHVIVALTR